MLKTKKIILVIYFLCLLIGTVNSQNRSPCSPFFFVHITDPQFGMIESDSGYSKETELYEKAVMAINRLNPDFVVITGDLVNKKNDKSQIAEFKRITAEISTKIPVYYSPGNHDIGQSPTMKDIDSFVSDFGPDRFSFSHKKCLFIGINSCIIKSNTPLLEQVQFDWLKEELSKGKKTEHIIIFSHYPFFLNAFDEPVTYSNIPVEIRNRYLSLLSENNVKVVFAGHLHNNSSSKYGNLDMVITCAVGKPLAKAPSGIRIIKVFSKSLESVYYPIDEIPEAVIFK
jgi:3',5'-cyclic AMP phosphodiesterase CpdA